MELLKALFGVLFELIFTGVVLTIIILIILAVSKYCNIKLFEDIDE